MNRLCSALFIAVLALPALAGEVTADAVKAAAEKASKWAATQQNADGTFGKSKGAVMPGHTGIIVKGMADAPGKEAHKDVLTKAAGYMVSKQQTSGAIAIPEMGLDNYNTSCAVIALVALEDPAYKSSLEKAKKYIVDCQLVDAAGYNKEEHPRAYGGFGYGNSQRTDVSNTAFAMEALKELGFEEGSPAWKNAVIFLKRSQDNEETNDSSDMKGGDNTGGSVYLPGDSEFGKVKARSGKMVPKPYGNMTYQSIKSLIYAKIGKDDPALQAAFRWVKNNYAADKQPGGKDNEGYFYYAVAFAKAFTAMGEKEIELADGRKGNWAKDLATHLLSLQKEDGSFVNTDKRWMEDDPALATGYALQALNLCAKALAK